MTLLDISCIAALLAITVVQVVLVARFARICRAVAISPRPDAPCLAPARIILCLRGSDPFLGETIRAAVSQDHPDYELRVIVDSRDDPAWAEVQAALASMQPRCRVVVEPLGLRPATSSLKCASLLQGLRDAERDTAMVALLDADVVPPPTWLRTLGTALTTGTCGVATGNRWYAPPDGGLGSWTRAGWSAGALVQMVCFDIPWGGTLAIRSGLLETAALRAKWAAALCEDTLLPAALAGSGHDVAFVPSLIAVNRESVSMEALVPWVTRQLLTARLYHPAWPTIAMFGLSTPVTLALAALALGLAMHRGDTLAVASLLVTIGVFLASLPALFIWIERVVMHTLEGQTASSRPAMTDVARGTFMAQCLHPLAILRTMTLRSTRWRGATYVIDGPWSIRLVAVEDPVDNASSASLHSI